MHCKMPKNKFVINIPYLETLQYTYQDISIDVWNISNIPKIFNILKVSLCFSKILKKIRVMMSLKY